MLFLWRIAIIWNESEFHPIRIVAYRCDFVVPWSSCLSFWRKYGICSPRGPFKTQYPVTNIIDDRYATCSIFHNFTRFHTSSVNILYLGCKLRTQAWGGRTLSAAPEISSSEIIAIKRVLYVHVVQRNTVSGF